MLLSAVLMLVLSVVLSFVPFLGPFVAGVTGGYFCGTVKRAILSAILPAILVGVFVWWWISSREHGLGGVFIAVGILPLVLVDELGLWAGVITGSVVAARRRQVRGARAT